MNTMNVVSVECSHYMCEACNFDDCACHCHCEAFEDDPTDMRGPGDDDVELCPTCGAPKAGGGKCGMPCL